MRRGAEQRKGDSTHKLFPTFVSSWIQHALAVTAHRSVVNLTMLQTFSSLSMPSSWCESGNPLEACSGEPLGGLGGPANTNNGPVISWSNPQSSRSHGPQMVHISPLSGAPHDKRLQACGGSSVRACNKNICLYTESCCST